MSATSKGRRSEEGLFVGSIALEIVSKLAAATIRNGSLCGERRDPTNALSQLVASLLTASHLPELERLQDDGAIREDELELLRGC